MNNVTKLVLRLKSRIIAFYIIISKIYDKVTDVFLAITLLSTYQLLNKFIYRENTWFSFIF